jgi:Tfp pilus assembly protein PilN
MSIRSNGTTCLSFDKNEITFLVFDPAAKQGLDHHTITCDFEVADDSGKIINPATLGAYLHDYFETHNLPYKCRVAVNLKFLDLKQLFFPMIPDEELREIIRDEATRESIFSYSGDPIAVAYKITGVKKTDAGFTNKEVITATTPENVIESIRTTFENTGLKLLSVQPNLEGLELFFKYKIATEAPVVLVNLASGHAEFYIWSDGRPKFWRYLSVGADEPERLTHEVTLSLEHYRRRAGNEVDSSFRRVLVVGQAVSLALDPSLQVEYLSGEPLADLFGLGLVDPDKVRFFFINTQEKNASYRFTLCLVKAWPFGLIILLALGLWSGWEIIAQRRQMDTLRQQQTEMANTRTSLEKQLEKLKKLNVPLGNPAGNINLYFLLENLRRIVPPDMRFEKLVLNVNGHQLQIEGFCLESQSLSTFLQETKHLNYFKTVSLVDSIRQNRSELEVLSFRLEILLGEYH